MRSIASVRRLAALLTVGALSLTGCGRDEAPSETPSDAALPAPTDPGPVHVHGLDENPRDGALFVATHTGLFRIEGPGAAATRIAGRYQDTMGFTVTGPDRFLGSGHPDGREGLPPFLGLIESPDAGESWKPRSLQGDVDFHVLEASRETVYGFGSDFDSREARFLVSEDGGREWTQRTPPEPLMSLAIDPQDPAHVVASGEAGLHSSGDGGARWRPLEGRQFLLSWPVKGRLYAVDGEGNVHFSRDGGRLWTVRGDAGTAPAAFEATGPDELYVAGHDGTIKRSSDGGRSWREFYSGS